MIAGGGGIAEATMSRFPTLPAILAAALALGGCSMGTLETSQAWTERMETLIQPGMTRGEVEAAMAASRYVILDGPPEQVRPPRALTGQPYAEWRLLIELEERVGCTEQRHMHLRFGADGRLEERIARGFLGCT